MWVLFALLNPVADASRGIFSKKASSKVDALLVSWFNNLIPFVLFSPALFFIELEFNNSFLIALFVSGVVNITATILFHKSIQKGDLSIVVPMLSFTPLFLLFMSPLIVNEFPDATGFAGVIFIVAGSYLLNVDLKRKSIFAPIKALVKNKGTRYMLIVSFIFSISSNFDKVGIEASSVYQYIIFLNLFVSVGITIIISSKRKLKSSQIKLEWKNLFLVGFFTALGYLFHMTALELTLVAYVIALKRTSGMISVGFGYLFFKEKNIKDRLLGASIMFIGVLFIVLF